MVEDTADIHLDDLAQVADIGIRREWQFRPTAKQMHDLAEPLRDDRIASARIDRQREEIAARVPAPKVLPAPTPSRSDLDALASLGFTWDERGNAVRIKQTSPTRPREPLKMPTQADLQAIVDELDAKPIRQRMTMTAADYAALGMSAHHTTGE